MDTPTADPPVPQGLTAERIKEEYIIQRMNLWLSRRDKEPLTGLEIAVKVTGIQLDKPLSLPEIVKPACVIPTPDGDYYYIPFEDNWNGAPEELKQKARRIDACARNPAYRELFKEAERLLDREILEKRHLEGHKPVDMAKMAAALSSCPFTKKVHFCAKKRLMGISLTPRFDSSEAKFAKFNFAKVDINKDAKIDMKWDNLDWAATFSELRESCAAHARSFFSFADAMSDQIKVLETIKTCPSAALQADELLSRLRFQLQIERQKENPFREGEAEFALNWVKVDHKNNKNPRGELHLVNDVSCQSLPETGLQTQAEFFQMKYEAQERQKEGIFPIFMRPWNSRYYCMLREVGQLYAQELTYIRQIEEEEKKNQEKNKEGEDGAGEGPSKGKRKRASKGEPSARKKRATGAPNAGKGAPKSVNGAPKSFNGAPKSVNGVQTAVNRAPQIANEAPHMVNGAPHMVNGVPRMVNGVSRIANGVPNTVNGVQNAVNGVN